MNNHFTNLFIITLAAICILGCKKDRNCNSSEFEVSPFIETFGRFYCNDNVEYSYIFRKEAQVDSLRPFCFFSSPVAFPLDETDMVYIAFGKISYYRMDTFYTKLYLDTCHRILRYDVNMIQRSKDMWQYPGVMSMFCSVDSVPEDYEVIIDYEYVPLE